MADWPSDAEPVDLAGWYGDLAEGGFDYGPAFRALRSARRRGREVFAEVRHAGRRTGAVMLVDADGTLAGLFTDSDLARLFERHDDGAFDRPMADVMTRQPITLTRTARVAEAVEVLRARKISELPVVDEDGRPVGMLDITDLIGLDAEAEAGERRPVLRVLGPDVG